MSSSLTSPTHGLAEPERDDIERLRCPGERIAFVLCVVSNFVVVAAAIAVVMMGTDWVEGHPAVARHLGLIRTILITGVFAVPATILGKRISFAATRGNGVRIDEHQLPELHARFVAACRKLGVHPMPSLYMSRDVDGVAVARAGGTSVVVNAEFVDEDWKDGLDWLTFAVARALGAVRLGHTRWWVELLTVYARSIPGIRTPLLLKWSHSRDRCAAFVVPDGIRGLLVEASGNHALPAIDVPAFVEQTKQTPTFWDRLAAMVHARPLLLTRARALYDGGFFDRARDEARK